MLAVLILSLALIAHGQALVVATTNSPVTDKVILPKSVPDPIEPFNRVM